MKKLHTSGIRRSLEQTNIRLHDMRHHAREKNYEGMTEEEVTIAQYKAHRWSKLIFVFILLAVFIILAGAELAVGDYDIDLWSVYSILIDHIFLGKPIETLEQTVVWEFRTPRVLTAIAVGIGLAMAGAGMQSMMKNPLADPYTTGISSGAALGATLAMTLGFTLISGTYGTIINAFVFALIPSLFIIALSKYRKPSPAMIILSGIALMYVFNAAQSYLMLVADPNATSAVYAWTVGSIDGTDWGDMPFMWAVVILGAIIMMYLSRILNAMNSGDSYAKSLGINTDRTRVIILLSVSILAAGIVSFTGIIGFVGLVAPHIARILIGADNRILIPLSALVGACLMMVADLFIQAVLSFSMPVGLITSLIGGPIFMIMIIRQKNEVW
ncbi:MAG: iron ABC transporter permease [Candidatus Methanomethylophilaceae archaeon]|nr:iron ABC transporter permease [Candidatus Methanomethylophilaceae archaeon]